METSKKGVEQWVPWLSNCLLGMSFEFCRKGESESRLVVCSAFVIEIGAEWVLVTAGHVYDDILKPYQENLIKIDQVRILDGFGDRPKTNAGFPIDLESVMTAFYYDKKLGLDVGFIALNPHDRRLLEANNIRVFPASCWYGSHNDLADAYILLGLPQEKVVADSSNWQVATQLLQVKATSEPPAHLVKDVPRFYGVIQNLGETKSIVGMSGGPLLGFHRNEEGELRYWIVGLQNGWDSRTHTIAVCPMDIVLTAFVDWYGSFLEPDIATPTS